MTQADKNFIETCKEIIEQLDGKMEKKQIIFQLLELQINMM